MTAQPDDDSELVDWLLECSAERTDEAAIRIKTLRRERDELRAKLEKELLTVYRERDEARAALEVFATEAEQWLDTTRDDLRIGTGTITLGDLRHARAVRGEKG